MTLYTDSIYTKQFICSPNPNNGNMRVNYEIPVNTTGVFEFYDIMGKKLFSYILDDDKSSFSFSHSDLKQGIYFYRAIVDNIQIASDKILVIK